MPAKQPECINILARLKCRIRLRRYRGTNPKIDISKKRTNFILKYIFLSY
jgi:hypothetical protein